MENVMTHDELLAKIDYWFDTDNFHLHKNALRAVVELHKPHPRRDECMFCGWECGTKLVSFPCPTIQAIEKELK
jgi:hypothetical protein